MSSVATTKDLYSNILDAVDLLLSRYGYQKMTVDDVAREAGIGKGTVYLYFPSKEEMALSSIDRLIDKLLVRLIEISASPDPIPGRLEKMLVERVLFRFDNLHQDAKSLDAMFAVIRPAFLARRQNYFELETHVLASAVEEGMLAGVLRPGDPAAIARTMLDATNALLPFSLSALELGHRSELESKAMRIADLLLNGLTTQAPSGASTGPADTQRRKKS